MFPIALNTFREIIRNKFFGLLAFLSVIFIAFSLVLDTLSLGETRRVLFDFWLSFMEISGFSIILFLAGGMITREIEGRTIYLMLSKPIDRWSIILWKFLGFSAVILLVLALECLLLIGLVSFAGFELDRLFFLAVVGILFKLESLLALILFFSTFVSGAVAVFMTLAAYIVGHSGYIILEHALSTSNQVLLVFARVLLGIFPNLESLNIKNYVATGAELQSSNALLAYGIALVYIVLILFLSTKLFQRKSFDAV